MSAYSDSAPSKKMAPSIIHTFPLREENDIHMHVDASVTIPRDLTIIEAERLCAWIKTLARDVEEIIHGGKV